MLLLAVFKFHFKDSDLLIRFPIISIKTLSITQEYHFSVHLITILYISDK